MSLALYLPEDREGSEIDSVLYHSDSATNECEKRADGGCVTDYGFYFGTSDTHEPTFCPAHYFQGGGYKIEPK